MPAHIGHRLLVDIEQALVNGIDEGLFIHGARVHIQTEGLDRQAPQSIDIQTRQRAHAHTQ